MNTTIVGFPRIGKNRELKFLTERYFKKEITLDELNEGAKNLRVEHLKIQNESIDMVSVGDFSFYDGMLDTSIMLGVIPKRHRDLNLCKEDLYFAIAKGYQDGDIDVKASSMKKWFNTNYHYITPEIDDETKIELSDTKILNEFLEAKEIGIDPKAVLIGPFTFLKLAKYYGKKREIDFVKSIADAYVEIIKELAYDGCKFIQMDEPILVTDLTQDDIKIFKAIYKKILAGKPLINIILQTYFGDIRDVYRDVLKMGFNGLGLDFVEGEKTLELVNKYGMPENLCLFAGVINGKNIWKSEYSKIFALIKELMKKVKNIVLSTSCSLLHVPYTTTLEKGLSEFQLSKLSFAQEKLKELKEISTVIDTGKITEQLLENDELFKSSNNITSEVTTRISNLTDADYIRLPNRSDRVALQKDALNLPVLPTTTIGSFPQTRKVRINRSNYKSGKCTCDEYESNIKGYIKECINLQEDLGFDVLVHGEFERNDMVEFFGENLNGFIFTKFAWVQSYGTRCVKPPIIFSDVYRTKPITVDISKYAQSLSTKPVKGMLTGPITILNWSFPRADIEISQSVLQIALAIRDEVLDLEKNGIKIIQIDEAALREKLPIRKEDWNKKYLDWAIPAFRLTHSGVKPETQIHTHMCYSEFDDIIKEIDDMDADVISFEASRSSLEILKSLKDSNFETQVGPGVYDIHSPRVPSVDEIVSVINNILKVIPKEKVWVNPDCGLKTRDVKETLASLTNLIEAAKSVRAQL
ncbi:MAG: 5-methyltetrahydropteroyltriglutamate--homocysteine S-methyltransferase [Christensenellaceae bacterium]|jgi:5-methyltetrahydropteroyltriglutamate--homocysteine methyltransferase|nr:5-methyltetrahydropteroyltriglutamate--homocysteine S-methyltransferase [Christensenellaceae bacterium]